MPSGASESKKIMRHSKAVPHGPTLINRLEKQMDKRRKIMEDMVIKHGMEDCLLSEVYIVNKGRYEGIAASIAILRSSSVTHEVERSNGRLGIE